MDAEVHIFYTHEQYILNEKKKKTYRIRGIWHLAAQTCIQFCMENILSAKKTSFRPHCNLPQYLIYFPLISLL